jgi:hypothetical protein
MEAVLNDISLDNLARVMTDIHMDSSKAESHNRPRFGST